MAGKGKRKERKRRRPRAPRWLLPVIVLGVVGFLYVRPITTYLETRSQLGIPRNCCLTFFFTHKAKPTRNVDKIARFGCGSGRDVEKIEILIRPAACTSFNDVARSGYSCTSQLALKPEAFSGRKPLCDRVDRRDEAIGESEYAKLPVITAHARRAANVMP